MHEGRVSEWLQRKTFAVSAPDLRPALDSLHYADEASVVFVRSVQAAATNDMASTTQPILCV